MRVLFVSYPHIGLNIGGLQVQIEETARYLQLAGIDILFYNPWTDDLPNVDIIHLFSLHPAIGEFGRIAKNRGKPVVVSSVLNIFDRPKLQLQLQVSLAKRSRGIFTSLKEANNLLHHASKVIALTDMEKSTICDAFDIKENKVKVIPNGVDEEFGNGNPDLFYDKYGLKDFILCVGRIEPRKNQLNLIKACNRGQWPLVLIGPPNPAFPEYMQKCKEEAGKNVSFLGSINHDDPLLKSAFYAAKVFSLVSYSEVYPITVLEAGIAGTRIVLTKNTAFGEMFGNLITRTETNETSIYNAINSALDNDGYKELKNKISSFYTWNTVAEHIKNVYDEVI